MCDLILLCGIDTVSWYAELAFRRRVSMSAIGSVMVMFGLRPLSPWFPICAIPLPEQSRDGCGAGTYGVVRRSWAAGAQPFHSTGGKDGAPAILDAYREPWIPK
ncbi:hypothetical protein GCM10010319_16830 [Streptomyces blastmyceticus]|uniref:Uncharacterized protein n=1 Tax=Streptomyces blastmyceticus TaxID=68180 RepID=A0ABP3GD12_9ACTN